ncbi:MAG: tetratricopeptide repeat protein [Calditrichaeota bacterium]|nr:tetratricopeptide repeat protein [Calditrichota bacterium]
MFKPINVLRTAVVLGVALLVVLQTGCAAPAAKAEPVPVAAEEGEIPITTASEEARAVFLEGREMSEHLRTDEAREHFDKAIELDPDFAQAYLYRSFDFTSDEDLKSHLKQAVALADKVSEGERLLIQQRKAFWLDNNLGEQLELCKQLAQKYPKDKRARNLLGAVYYSRDEDAKAIAELEAAVALDKDYPPPYNVLGYAYREIGEYEKAEQAFKDYITLIPDEPNPYDSMADLYMKTGRFEEAIENYQKAVELDPVFGISQQKIGTSLVFLGKYDEGREACKKAIKMEMTPWDQLEDRDMIVRSYLYEGDYPKAIEATEKLLEAGAEAGLPSWIPYAHLMRSRILKEAGDLDAAEQSLTEYHLSMEGADFNPYFMDSFARDALVVEARIAAKRQDFETALAKAEDYKAKLEAREDPNTMENYHGLVGMIYFDKDDHEKAIEHFRQSNQENAYTLYYHAVAQSKAGNKDEAAKLFKRAALWNEDSYDYAFIRAKALAALKE